MLRNLSLFSISIKKQKVRIKLFLKVLCNFLIFCGGVSVLASTDNKSSSDIFSNGRIGIGVAGEYANIDTSLKIRSPVILGNISSTQQQTCKRFQLAPSLELGATIMDNYYLGFIASWRYLGASTTSITPIRGAYHFSHEFKLQSYTDVFIKFGYKPTRQALFYGLVGPSIADWSHTTQQVSVNSVAQVSKVLNTFEMRERTLGLGVGAGAEYVFKDKYAFSFDYVFHIHHSRSATRTINYIDGYNPYARKYNVRSGDLVKIVQPSYSTFAVRFTYFFSVF